MTALSAVAALALAACGTETDENPEGSVENVGTGSEEEDDHGEDDHEDAPDTGDPTGHDDEHDHDHGDETAAGGSDDEGENHEDHDHGAAGEAVDTPSPRLAVMYDGGLLVVDAMTLEVVEDLDLVGLRARPVGDGRHLFVIGERSSVHLLDMGTWSEPHGNHDHSYVDDPVEVDVDLEGAENALVREGLAAIWYAVEERVDVVDTDDLAEIDGTLPVVGSFEVVEPGNGVAVPVEDGGVLQTLPGDVRNRGVVALDADGGETARSEDCPSGDTPAVEGETVTFGCLGGALLYQDGEFATVDAPDDQGRVGLVAGHPDSPVVVGTYDEAPDDAELTAVALIDTEAASLEVVELPPYPMSPEGTLARGPEGEGLVLGYDGVVRVIDVSSGEVTDEIEAVEAWESEPGPEPQLFVLGQFAYVSEPATSSLHVIDLATGEVVDSAELPQVPMAISGVTGADDAHGAHGGHDH